MSKDTRRMKKTWREWCQITGYVSLKQWARSFAAKAGEGNETGTICFAWLRRKADR